MDDVELAKFAIETTVVSLKCAGEKMTTGDIKWLPIYKKLMAVANDSSELFWEIIRYKTTAKDKSSLSKMKFPNIKL